MKADGSDVRRLTEGLGLDLYPTSSPDGSRIAFCSTRDGNHEIYVMNADGSHQRNVTDNEADDDVPDWG